MRVLICALLTISIVTGQSLTTEQVAAAIAYGSHYKTKDKFLEKGLRGVRVKLASAMALDGISKFATFFNDWNYIAAEAAGANQQLREVKPDDFHPEGCCTLSLRSTRKLRFQQASSIADISERGPIL